MVDVSRISTASSGIGGQLNQAGFFNNAINKNTTDKKGEWRGGAKHEGNVWAGSTLNAAVEEKTASEDDGQQKPDSGKMRQFFAKDLSNADYGIDYRVDSWFARAPKDTNKFSSNWK